MWSFLSKIDQPIDSIVDEVLASYSSDSALEFKKKLASLSVLARWGLRAMVKEQIAAESDPERKTKLQQLQYTL